MIHVTVLGPALPALQSRAYCWSSQYDEVQPFRLWRELFHHTDLLFAPLFSLIFILAESPGKEKDPLIGERYEHLVTIWGSEFHGIAL